MLRISAILLLTAVCLRAQVPEVVYLKFNEGSGSVTADGSLLGLPGFNAFLTGPGSSPVWNNVDPKLGGSCFSRIQGMRHWAFNSSVQLNDDWTFEAWLRPSTFASNGGYIPLADMSMGGFLLRGKTDLFGTLGADNDDLAFETDFAFVVLNKAFSPGTWVHVAVVCDRAEGTLTPFVNGEPKPGLIFNGSTDIMGTDPAQFRTLDWDGDMDEVRIWNHARSPGQIAAAMNTELSAVGDDLIVSAITSPVYVPRSYVFPGSSEVVSCEIENAGTNSWPAGSLVSLSFQVNGGPAVTETMTLSSSLAPGDRALHSFTQTADLSGLGPQTVTVTVNSANDQNPGNDSRDRVIGGASNHLVNEFPWFENFDDAPVNFHAPSEFWMQEVDQVGTLNETDWQVIRQSTLASPLSGGPAARGAAGTSSGFTFVTRMISPTFDLRGLLHPRLRFWAVHDIALLPSNPAASLAFDVIDVATQQVTTDVFLTNGSIGPDWCEFQVDLTAFAGKRVDIRIRTVAPTNLVHGQPILIDDLWIYDHQVGPGQSPQPGLAVMDINDSMNVGFNFVDYGEPGPYFCKASPGSPLVFRFEGRAGQPVLLAYGPLNPVAATYPNIGQLDIGGPVDPITGIPSTIQVLFDGNLAGGLNPLFVTGPTGVMTFQATMPYLPPGILTTFQAVLRDPSSGTLVIANAIEVEVE